MRPAPRSRTAASRAAVLAVLSALVAGLLSIGAAGASAASGTPLRGDGMYPRAVRLEHSGAANGRIVSSVVTFDGNNGVGTISESTDAGRTFAEVGQVRAPDAAGGKGLCCSTLYELPQAVGGLPAGTLLWSASIGQDTAPRHMSLQVFRSNDVGRTWSYLSTVATAADERGLWEPEFSVAADGQLVPTTPTRQIPPTARSSSRPAAPTESPGPGTTTPSPALWPPTGRAWPWCGSCRTAHT
ncbi:sialidase family protein [Streptomyces sp. RKAG290]|uniref:sialidase family protein n=1 Tax=Streptomyces sp. RKAG290 TaxID=2888348 RepID=UPI0020342E64|nr:sialidase family protein [Streptomyces sp. RKAG290]MCM2416483.1 glycoside hydrolase [Streptomyces sp. RKAG290]